MITKHVAEQVKEQATLAQFLVGGISAAAIAIVINQLWRVIAPFTLGTPSLTEPSVTNLINPVTITVFCLVTILFGALVYYILALITRRATAIFVIGSLLLTVGSLYSSLNPPVTPTPEGFFLLSAPMHIVAGLCCALITPRFVR